MVKVEFQGGMRFVGRCENGHTIEMDAGTKSGGAGSAARPIDVLLSALGGCTGMDVLAILRKMRTEPTRLFIEVDGTRADTPPKRFEKIHLTYVVAGDVPEENLRKAIDLSLTKYCPVAGTLAGVAEITTGFRIERG